MQILGWYKTIVCGKEGFLVPYILILILVFDFFKITKA